MKLTEAITFKHLIREARRNPEMNQRVSINDRIISHLNNASNIPGTNIPNSFVSFTTVDKLGVNPNSGWSDTPVGIYSYPSYEVVKLAGSTSTMIDVLPYAGEFQHASVFSVKGNIMDLATLSMSELHNMYVRMIRIHKEIASREDDMFQLREKEVEEHYDYVFGREAQEQAYVHSNGGHFWYATSVMAEDLMQYNSWGTSSYPVSWNKVFRALGLDGCIDSQGERIIHENEPTQAVLFSGRGIDKLNRFDNAYAPDQVEEFKAQARKDRERKEQSMKSVEGLKETVLELEPASEEAIIMYIKENEETFFPIEKALMKALAETDSTNVAKQVLLYHAAKGQTFSAFREFREKSAIELSDRDIASVVNRMTKYAMITEFPELVCINKDMDMDLIDSSVFEKYTAYYMRKSEDARKVLLDSLDRVDVYEDNPDFIRGMIENAPTGSPALLDLITTLARKNRSISVGELTNLSSLYIDLSLETSSNQIESPEQILGNTVDEVETAFKNGFNISQEKIDDVINRIESRYGIN